MSDPGDWRAQRRIGIAAIAASGVVAAVLWLALRYAIPPIAGMETLADRMVFTAKCSLLAVLFCLVMGVEAVAHERLQTAAFDPATPNSSRRLWVNQRYLQNTLEQVVVFIAAIFGLALYSPDGAAMRAVLATTAVWILARFAFWIGYHHSAALRGLGAPGMAITLIALIYAGARIGSDVAGTAGAVVVIVLFLAIEAVLFRTTREG